MIAAAAVLFVVGIVLGYYVGYDHGFEENTRAEISSYGQCISAGYPMMKSFPPKCATPDGRVFVEEVAMPCTGDGLLCPDGSTVGRIPPQCQFAKCPGD